MGKFSRLGNDLYQGRKSYDFVGHRALWYLISGTLVGAAILVILIKGMNFGIEFTGGTETPSAACPPRSRPRRQPMTWPPRSGTRPSEAWRPRR